MIKPRSISHAKNKTVIKWAQDSNTADEDCFTLASFEMPQLSFFGTSEELKEELFIALEIPKSWLKNSSILSTNINRKPTQNIYSTKVVLNHEKGDLVMCMPDFSDSIESDIVKKYWDLELEAGKYIQGAREQTNLI